MLPWVERPTFEIDLGRPMARRFDSVPQEAIRQAKKLLVAVIREIPAAARLLAYGVRLRTGNRFQREAAALARMVSGDWRDVIVANISYDLVLARFGCSTVVLATSTGPVLARNMDWWPEDILAQSSYLARYGKRSEFKFANAGWPGSIGVVSGLSGRGFGIVLNAVRNEEGIDKTGYPVLLHIRRVLEDAVDFDAALTMLAGQHLAAPALFTLVGSANNQRVVIERTCRRSALRWPRGSEPLVATNDYRLLLPPEATAGSALFATTCGRYASLSEFFAAYQPKQDVADAALLYALSDPSVIQGITAQHVIIRPRQRQIRLFVPQRLLEERKEDEAVRSEV